MTPIETATLRYSKVYEHLMRRLENELPPHLTYHHPAHTQSVIDVAGELASRENLTEEEVLILKTAALFHDAGFLHAYKNHEEASCELAKEILPSFGYSNDEIVTVCECIMATKLPQRPKNKLEQIICDADLHYLGTDNYREIAESLYNEFRHEGIVSNRAEWLAKQYRFVDSHIFFTNSAKETYNNKKQENLRTLHKHSTKKQHPAKRIITDVLLIACGTIIAGFGLQGFLVPNHFFDGGVTGLSLLAHEVYHVHLALAIAILNTPFIIAAYRSVSPSFALKTSLSIIALGVAVTFIPYPTMTSDKLLISIFGGVFLGLGLGLVMRAGSAVDGIEVLALYTFKRTSFTITEIILALNVIIFSIAGLRFGIETSLYSILTYFTASRVVDYVVEGLQAYTGVTIISSQSESIKYRLVNDLGRGITVYKGERGFLPGSFNVSNDVDIIFTVVTRLEMRKLKNLVHETDPKAFIFASTIREAAGGVINRRSAH